MRSSNAGVVDRKLEGLASPADRTWGVTLAIVGTFLFALKSIFIKLAFAAGANATLVLAIRMTLALPFYVGVLWYLRRREDRKPLQREHVIRATTLGFLGYYLASYLDLAGLEQISAQLERLTLFTYPAMVAVLAWLFLGEQINRKIVLAIALSYFGVLLMYGQERAFTSVGDTSLGVMLVIGSALSYSFYILFAKPVMKHIGSQQFTSLAMIGSTFFVGVHFAATQPLTSLVEAKPIVYVYGLILAFVCTVIPSFMINEAIMRIGATRTTVIGSVGPVLTMMLAIFVLSEPSSLQHFLGMAVAIYGVSLVARK
ncbi:DMT family transporter [Rubripirellula amarantea]|uniref:DMT family transporter n=1 Tax=Rubripirellula amarantea TaxID=2527999 RepID=UPI0011B4EB09|nr:DMT family transporter [Rubripirellula amarantea]